MRTRVVTLTLALVLASSLARAQYGASPSQLILNPENPAIFGQIEFGARITTVDGDEARYMRYRDLRDGPFFDLTALREERGGFVLIAAARNVGWRDQRYQVSLERPGTFRFRFLYDQTPTFISRDTRTPYDPLPASDGSASSTLRLPDSLQTFIQANPTTNFRPAIEAAADSRYFDSRILRTTAGFDARYTRGSVDTTVNYQHTGKEGNIPFGAYLQIPIEVPLPIDSRTHDIRTSVEWANAKGLLRAGWDGSWYDNRAAQFVWDNPQRVVDASNAGSQGRLAEWPSNNLMSFNVVGVYRMPRHTTVNGVFAMGLWNQNTTLLPFTINTAVTFLPTPSRPTAAAKADTTSVVLNLTSHAWRLFDISARYRLYEFDNKTPPFVVARTDGNPDRVTADGSANVWANPAIGRTGSEPLGYKRNYIDLDASYNRVRNTSLRVGYSRYAADTHYRVYERVTEDTFRLGADIVGTQYLSLRSVYEHSQRRGGHFDAAALVIAGEQPGMRHFDIAPRDRDRLWAVATLTPAPTVGINASVAWTADTYLNPETATADKFGLQDSTSTTYTTELDWEPRAGLSAAVSMSIEDFGGMQQSRTGNATQIVDPTRNWALDESNKAWSGIASLDWLSGIKNTELRFQYNYTNYKGNYTHRLPSNTTLTAPIILPAVTSVESRATVDLRYFLSKRLAIGFVYWYDSYNVEDFSLSPDVVSGVAQPAVEEGQNATVNALMLNYFYRPFKAHTAWLRMTYGF